MITTPEQMREAAMNAVEDYCSDMPDLAGHGHSVGLKDSIRAIPIAPQPVAVPVKPLTDMQQDIIFRLIQLRKLGFGGLAHHDERIGLKREFYANVSGWVYLKSPLDALTIQPSDPLSAAVAVKPWEFDAPYTLINNEKFVTLLSHGMAIATFGIERWGNLQTCIEAAWRHAYEDRTEPVYVPADPLSDPRVVALVDALEYIMDGYGLNPPEFKQTEYNEDGELVGDDWIVSHIRSALRAIGGEA